MTRPAIPDDEHLEEDLVDEVFWFLKVAPNVEEVKRTLRAFALKVVEASVPEETNKIYIDGKSSFNYCRSQTLSNAKALLGVKGE